MAEYQMRCGLYGKYVGSSIIKARKDAIAYLKSHKSDSFVGIFGNTSDTVKSMYGRVGRTNTAVYFTWEIRTKEGYKLVHFLKEDGTVVHPTGWFYEKGAFYY